MKIKIENVTRNIDANEEDITDSSSSNETENRAQFARIASTNPVSISLVLNSDIERATQRGRNNILAITAKLLRVREKGKKYARKFSYHTFHIAISPIWCAILQFVPTVVALFLPLCGVFFVFCLVMFFFSLSVFRVVHLSLSFMRDVRETCELQLHTILIRWCCGVVGVSGEFIMKHMKNKRL